MQDEYEYVEDIFRGYGVEVILPDEDSFLKIRETLTRIGVSSRKENKQRRARNRSFENDRNK